MNQHSSNNTTPKINYAFYIMILIYSCLLHAGLNNYFALPCLHTESAKQWAIPIVTLATLGLSYISYRCTTRKKISKKTQKFTPLTFTAIGPGRLLVSHSHVPVQPGDSIRFSKNRIFKNQEKIKVRLTAQKVCNTYTKEQLYIDDVEEKHISATLENIKLLTTKNSARVTCNNLSNDYIRLEAWGNSVLHIKHITAQIIEVFLYDQAEIKISQGTVREQYLYIFGTGTYDAQGLTGEYCTIERLNKNAKIFLHVTKELSGPTGENIKNTSLTRNLEPRYDNRQKICSRVKKSEIAAQNQTLEKYLTPRSLFDQFPFSKSAHVAQKSYTIQSLYQKHYQTMFDALYAHKKQKNSPHI